MKHNNAVRLVATRGLSREEWLAVRNRGIGSSDAAAAVGLSPYKSPLELWLEKTQRKPADDLSDLESVFWGTTLEPILARVYAERTGRKVRRVNAVLQHPQHAHMLANLDRAVGHEGLLEIKTAGHHSAPQWEESVPVAYQCQVLHQLAVTGRQWADVAVLIAGQDFRIYRIERDDEKIEALVEREAEFWQHVIHDVAPDSDGSESSGRALGWLYPQDSGRTLDCSDSATLNQLFHELLQAKRHREHLDFLETSLRQSIQAAMGDASTAVFALGKVTWKSTRERSVTDWVRLRSEHPKLVAQYTVTEPGVRRFLMQLEKPELAKAPDPLPAIPLSTKSTDTPTSSEEVQR